MIFLEVFFAVNFAAAIERKIELPDSESLGFSLTYDIEGNAFATNCTGNIWQVILRLHKNEANVLKSSFIASPYSAEIFQNICVCGNEFGNCSLNFDRGL